jgi:uncharacterized protein YbaR (Trm112 family)
MTISLACPSCHRLLSEDKATQNLICAHEKLAFPIIDGIPVLIIDQAKPWDIAS